MSAPLTVQLADRSYPIHIAADVQETVAATLASLRAAQRPVALLVDAAVAEKHTALIESVFDGMPKLSLPSGENTKSFQYLEQACEFLAQQRIDRSGALFALGGGVLGDLAGYTAASYLRGIDFYQIPTTLLAMVDSSVGGKTGINLQAGKNLVGAFWQPQAVYIGIHLLNTLPAREFAAGMAEIIKYGLLADAQLHAQLLNLATPLQPKHPELPAVIRRCCEIKADIVRADEKETAGSGGRALLNLGHTFAHAIENVAGYGYYLHGEAVAIGLVLAAKLSQRLGHLREGDIASISELIERNHLPVELKAPLRIEDLMAAMRRDKKVRAGKLRFVALQAIGQAITVDDIDEALVHDLWVEAGAS